MNKKEQNQFNMMQAVYQFLSLNATYIKKKTALMGAYKKLKIQIDSIEVCKLALAVDIKNETAIKSAERQKISDLTLKILSGMAHHGASINDTRLKMATRVKYLELKKLRDTDFVIKVHAIYQVAIPYSAQLAKWGIEKSDLDLLDHSATEYLLKSPDISNFKAKAIQANADLKVLLSETYAHIKTTIDPMMLPFKVLKPSFHQQYINARTIKNTASTRSNIESIDESPAA